MTLLFSRNYGIYTTLTEHEFYKKRPQKRHGRNIYRYPTVLKGQFHKDTVVAVLKARLVVFPEETELWKTSYTLYRSSPGTIVVGTLARVVRAILRYLTLLSSRLLSTTSLIWRSKLSAANRLLLPLLLAVSKSSKGSVAAAADVGRSASALAQLAAASTASSNLLTSSCTQGWKKPGFFKKNQPSGFFVFWGVFLVFFYIFAQKGGFFRVFSV